MQLTADVRCKRFLGVRDQQTTIGFTHLRLPYGEAGNTVLRSRPASPLTSCVKPLCTLVSSSRNTGMEPLIAQNGPEDLVGPTM